MIRRLTSLILTCVLTYFLVPGSIECHKTLNDTRTLHKHLFENYDKNIRPKINQTEVLDVSAFFYLKSIQELDEVKGVLSYSAAIMLEWTDESLVWNPADFGGISSVKASYNDVWVPELIIINPSENHHELGKEWQKITYLPNGQAFWNFGGLLNTVCDVNVRYFPFDTQVCDSNFTPWNYFSDEVRLLASFDKIDMTVYSDSPAWTVTNTEVHAVNLLKLSLLTARIHLERRPDFVIVSVLLPIFFISILNTFVFILTPESGERVSYCITVMLAIAVFFTIIADTLPKNSEPLPLINYKLMIDLIISSLITLVTIINTTIFHRSTEIPVPKWLQMCQRHLCFKSGNRKSTSSDGRKQMMSDTENVSNSVDNRHPSSAAYNVTWKETGRFLDKLAFGFFSTAILINFAVNIFITLS